MEEEEEVVFFAVFSSFKMVPERARFFPGGFAFVCGMEDGFACVVVVLVTFFTTTSRFADSWGLGVEVGVVFPVFFLEPGDFAVRESRDVLDGMLCCAVEPSARGALMGIREDRRRMLSDVFSGPWEISVGGPSRCNSVGDGHVDVCVLV